LIKTAWRIVQAHLAAEAFSGEGAKNFPGRWNHRGTAMVYAAGSLSLAVLEMLVHLGAAESLRRYISFTVKFEESLCRDFPPKDLPADWAADPPPDSARALGTAWAKNNASLVLAVPSAVIRSETNYLINPGHPDFSGLEIGPARPPAFDQRFSRLKEILS